MPLMYPRATATLVDSATARFLAKYDVPLEEFQPQDESALNRLLESQLPQSVEQAIKDAEDAMRADDGAGDRGDAGRRSDARRRGQDDAREDGAGSARAAEQDDSGGEDAATKRSVASSCGRRRRFFRSATRRNERSAVVYFLNRYGPAVIDRLLSELPLELGQHWVMTI